MCCSANYTSVAAGYNYYPGTISGGEERGGHSAGLSQMGPGEP